MPDLKARILFARVKFLAACVMFLAPTIALESGAARADALDSGIQRRLREAVFEVVMTKPETDPLTYEKELPLDLLPYTERVSKVRAIGTAFVIESNKFVTAAHVIAVGMGSQYGPLAVRDAAGNLYLIDRITKYSVAEDYAEFTVSGAPKVKPLDTDTHPEMNEAVFAVGDALGEGIVIRDGLYTSDTPEERSGRWKWLRFSAAASPGNSGGPLVDKKGRVIGVILRKSPSENLNSAVGIAQVQHGSTTEASLEARFEYTFPPMLGTEPNEIDDRIPLPKPIAEFYTAASAATDAAFARAHAHFLQSHAASVFPHGAESTQLLNQIYIAPLPRPIGQRPDNTWGVLEPKAQKAQLDHNGFVETQVFKGYMYTRVRPPDDMPAPLVYGDGRLFSELLLKGLQYRRTVGSDHVRITSLGHTTEEHTHKDAYGRTWQVRTWRVPYNDSVVISMGMPAPQGYIAIVKDCSSHLQVFITRELESLADFTYLSLEGTLKQWLDYLGQPLQPDILHTLDLHVDYGKEFHYRSRRLGINLPGSVQKIDPTSILLLKMTYFRDGDATVWDAGGVYLSDTDEHGRWIDILRRTPAPAGLPDQFGERWHAIETAAHPYTGTSYSLNGSTRIDTVANAKQIAAHESQVAYSVTVSNEGTQDQPTMKKELDAVVSGITVLEK